MILLTGPQSLPSCCKAMLDAVSAQPSAACTSPGHNPLCQASWLQRLTTHATGQCWALSANGSVHTCSLLRLCMPQVDGIHLNSVLQANTGPWVFLARMHTCDKPFPCL